MLNRYSVPSGAKECACSGFRGLFRSLCLREPTDFALQHFDSLLQLANRQRRKILSELVHSRLERRFLVGSIYGQC